MSVRLWLWGRYVEFDRHGLAGYGRTLMARRMLIGIEVER